MKKTKIMSVFKRILLTAIIPALLFGMVPSSIFAATITADVFGNHAMGSPNLDNGYFCKYVKIVNQYYNAEICNYSFGAHGGGAVNGNYDAISLFFVNIDGVDHAAYCIEPGAPSNGSWVYNGTDGATSTDPYWSYLRSNYRDLANSISLAIGYTNQYKGKSDFYAARAACQIIVWELMGGYRNAETLKVTNTELRNACAGSLFVKYYDLISAQLINHKVYPTFISRNQSTAPTITLPYDEEKQEWGKNVTTTTGTVDMIDFAPLAAKGISATKIDEKTVYLSTKSALAETTSCTTYKDLPQSLYTGDMYVWTSYSGGERGQCIVSGSDNDPVPMYFKLATETVYRNIEVNYYDKYTNEVIYTQYKDSGRVMNSEYDETARALDTIEYEGREYYYSSADGDALIGTMDTDKVINLYYGYNHTVTVNYFDKYTNEVIAAQYVSDPAQHLSFYNAADQKLASIEYNGTSYVLYDDLTTGDSFVGTLDADKAINLYYGYGHAVVVNYYDKYTDEKIAESYVSEQSEHNSLYDVAEKKLAAIEYNGINYELYDGLTTGDSLTGTLDTSKVINLYYGYNHSVTVEYRDEETGEIISETLTYSPENEHLSEYDKTEDTTLQIKGYTKTKVTGDAIAGTLDADKVIIVWYTKNPEPVIPDTEDIISDTFCIGAVLLSACLFTVTRRKNQTVK